MFWRRVNSTKKRSIFGGNVRRWWNVVAEKVIKKTPKYGRKEGRSAYDTRILSWQARELIATPTLKYNYPQKLFSLAVAKDIRSWVVSNIEWNPDQLIYGREDFWATSDEVLMRKKDDCDGQAVAIWKKMRNAGFNDDKIGMWCLTGNDQGHMVAIYQISETDAYVIDNGYLTTEIVLASELFADPVRSKGMKPVAGFNLWDLWIVG